MTNYIVIWSNFVLPTCNWFRIILSGKITLVTRTKLSTDFWDVLVIKVCIVLTGSQLSLVALMELWLFPEWLFQMLLLYNITLKITAFWCIWCFLYDLMYSDGFLNLWSQYCPIPKLHTLQMFYLQFSLNCLRTFQQISLNLFKQNFKLN